MATKMTKRDYFNRLLTISEVQADDELIKFVNRELELLAKKNSAGKKPTATQQANMGIKEAIYDGMQENRLYTITEIIKEIPEAADLTNQRVSALVRQMVADGLVVRTEEKRKAYFSKAC